MGIANLKDLLAKVNLLKTIDEESLDKYKKKKYNYHIDLSILIFKLLYTSKSYDDFISRFYMYFNNFKYNLENIERIIVYIDYSITRRKQDLREYRAKINDNEILKTKNEIIEKIKKSNKKYTYDINNLLNIKKIETKENFNSFFKTCNKDNFKEINYIFNVDNVESSNDIDMSILFQKSINEKKDKDICHYCFLLCIRKTASSLIMDDILDILEKLDNVILDKLTIRKCYKRDAEIDIINYIKTKKLNNNFIISSDNDAKIFSLIFFNKNMFFTDLSISINTNTFILGCNKKYSKNFSIITLFFTKNDYFPGISGFSMNTKKMLNFIINNEEFINILCNNELSIIEVLKKSIILIGEYYKIEIIELDTVKKNYIDELINNFILYISLKSEFYSKELKIKNITKNEIYTYFYNSNI